jgi:hypothetical protein
MAININTFYISPLFVRKFLSQRIVYAVVFNDRLCGIVVRFPGYRSRGSGLDSRRYQIFWEVLGLERVHSAS